MSKEEDSSEHKVDGLSSFMHKDTEFADLDVFEKEIANLGEPVRRRKSKRCENCAAKQKSKTGHKKKNIVGYTLKPKKSRQTFHNQWDFTSQL